MSEELTNKTPEDNTNTQKMTIQNRFPFAIKIVFKKGETYGSMTLKSGDETDILNDPDSVSIEVPPHVDLDGTSVHGVELDGE